MLWRKANFFHIHWVDFSLHLVRISFLPPPWWESIDATFLGRAVHSILVYWAIHGVERIKCKSCLLFYRYYECSGGNWQSFQRLSCRQSGWPILICCNANSDSYSARPYFHPLNYLVRPFQHSLPSGVLAGNCGIRYLDYLYKRCRNYRLLYNVCERVYIT